MISAYIDAIDNNYDGNICNIFNQNKLFNYSKIDANIFSSQASNLVDSFIKNNKEKSLCNWDKRICIYSSNDIFMKFVNALSELSIVRINDRAHDFVTNVLNFVHDVNFVNLEFNKEIGVINDERRMYVE